MDTRLEMEREPAQQSSRSAASGNGKLPHGSNPKQPTLADRLAKGGPTSVGAEHQSLDPMRATDRYRLVMPYSLRL